jgi:hypothetical protein
MVRSGCATREISRLEDVMKLSIVLLLAAGVALGCSKKESAETAEPAASAAGHAQAGVKPGSHEDWCGEHGVPESMCTRCNSSLIPAFKATGDWCAEHGLPESQCKICNPKLEIKRPPKGS